MIFTVGSLNKNFLPVFPHGVPSFFNRCAIAYCSFSFFAYAPCRRSIRRGLPTISLSR
jgi:hypothetical protein